MGLHCDQCENVIESIEMRHTRGNGDVICHACWLSNGPETVQDPVNHPPHYNQGKMETIQIWEGMGIEEEGCVANIIKYLSRYKYKDPSPEGKLEDLKKAKWYMDWLVAKHEKELASNGAQES